MFPVSINGEVSVGTFGGFPDEGELQRSLGSALELLGALGLNVQGNVITFSSSLFRIMLSTNLLATIRFGRIQVERRDAGFLLRYHLSMLQLVVVTTVVIPVFFGIPLVAAPNVSNPQAAVGMIFIWLFFAGSNWIITAVRFPRFLRRCAARSLESAGRS